jgi:AraC-like DNA-binding protein
VELDRTPLLEKSVVENFAPLLKTSMAQLERGTFEVRYGYVDAHPLTVSLRNFSLKISAEVALPPRMPTLHLTADPVSQAHMHGRLLDSASITTTPHLVDLVTNGPGTFYTIRIDERAVEREFPNAPDAIVLLDSVQAPNHLVDPIRVARLRRFCDQLFFDRSAQQPAMPPRSLRPKSICGALVPLLASAVEDRDSYNVEPSKCLTRRLAAVRACRAFMHEHLDSTVTLLDLCQVSGMRSRSLINAFAAVTGLTPMDYLKRLRLTGAHDALLRAGKSQVRIIDVAADWGFWHLGHFISHYHRMFGETPSETLRH